MIIVTKKPFKSHFEDGVHTIINLSKVKFDELINALQVTEKTDLERLKFKYDSEEDLGAVYDIQSIFQKLVEYQKYYRPNSVQYKRISRLIETRDFEKFKDYMCQKKECDREDLERAFENMASDEQFLHFIKGQHNEENKRALIALGKFFTEEVSLYDSTNMFLNFYNQSVKDGLEFYAPEVKKLRDRFFSFAEVGILDRYADSKYMHRYNGQLVGTVYPEKEPEFEVSEDIRKILIDDCPKDFTTEEKVLFMYATACKNFSFDQGYVFRNRTRGRSYIGSFNKEKLESIKPGDRVTCWDFSRILARCINGLQEEGCDVKANIVSLGKRNGHFMLGVYTDKTSFTLEAINPLHHSNDLTKAQNGIDLEGIQILKDKYNLLSKAKEKVLPLVYGTEPKTLEEYKEDYAQGKEKPVPEELAAKFRYLGKFMKDRNLSGDEAFQTYMSLWQMGFFAGENVEHAFVGRKVTNGEEEYYDRDVIIKIKQEESPTYVLFNTRKVVFKEQTKEQMIKKFKTGEYIYQDPDKTIEDFDIEK